MQPSTSKFETPYKKCVPVFPNDPQTTLYPLYTFFHPCHMNNFVKLICLICTYKYNMNNVLKKPLQLSADLKIFLCIHRRRIIFRWCRIRKKSSLTTKMNIWKFSVHTIFFIFRIIIFFFGFIWKREVL